MSIEITTLPTDTPASGDLVMFTDVSETPDALNKCTLSALNAVFAASTTEVLTGTETAKFVTPDALAALWEQGSNVASASTISLGEGGLFHITGTTTITDIDPATDKAGRFFVLVFDGALTITYSATKLFLPNSVDFTTAAGDCLLFVSEGSDAVRCVGYMKRGAETFLAKTINLTNNTLTGTKAEFDTACSDGNFRYTSGTSALETIVIAASDETTALTTGTAKVTFRMPFAMTLTSVRSSVTTAPTGATFIVDINEGGSTILSTKLSIDASEKTSTTAASAAVISDATLADDAEITIDFDQVGSTIAGAGAKVYLIGYRT